MLFDGWLVKDPGAALAPPRSAHYKRAHLTRGLWLRPSGGVRSKIGAHRSAAVQPEKIMSLPDFSMRQLLEAGVHFGHQAHRWNPKMGSYIFGVRNNIHIIDLTQTVPMLHRALEAVSDTVAKGGRILFVGTKRQAQDAIADAAKRCAQYYVNSRWLGGTLTNWKTISQSISRLRKIDEMLNSGEAQGYTKKERLTLQRERDKLDRALGGIKEMGGLPDLIFVIDTNKEDIAIKEARRLGLPVAAIVDTNCDPEGITHVVPGNDDASRAISLYCDLIAKAAIDGISRAQGEVGIDVGAAAEPIVEEVPAEAAPAGFQPLSGPRGVADDLKKLPGISPAIEKQLNDLGIFHYWQIAELGPADADRIGEEVGLPGRVEGWIAQAKEFTAE
jgi:small subunit ribosomal protein S2